MRYNRSLNLYSEYIILTVLIISLSGISVREGIPQQAHTQMKINDINLRVEKVADGLETPTSMAFLGLNDILVLEKNTGLVKRVKDGVLQPEPLLDANVANSLERCMCGIAISKNSTGSIHVFLYYTEAQSSDGDDKTTGKAPLGNRLYRYEFAADKLVNPKLMMDLPATPGPIHNGGRVTIGQDNNVYFIIGDVVPSGKVKVRTKAQNFQSGSTEPDGRSGILRISQEGELVGEGILGNNDGQPLDMYFAYGIRNGFGISFDPVTGDLWDTENGPDYEDEINLVKPGFNSGWKDIMGISKEWEQLGLVNFDGKGHYSDPEFVWNKTVAPTAIEFLNSSKLGSEYQNDIFVGDFKNGRIYNFNLNPQRTGLELAGNLSDKIANDDREAQEAMFGEGFNGVSDIKVGLGDGYLYVLSIYEGAIYRIVPKTSTAVAG